MTREESDLSHLKLHLKPEQSNVYHPGTSAYMDLEFLSLN